MANLHGKRVENWQGRVVEVNEHELLGGFTAHVDMIADFGVEVFIDLPRDMALSLNKGQYITFSGDIQQVMDLLGITVIVENAEIN